MRQYVAAVLFSVLVAPFGFGEVLASVGGSVSVDLLGPPSASPAVEATISGSHSWTPSDRLGLFLDWSGGGSYAPLAGSSAGLATISAGASYLAGGFLGKLQLSGVANPSTDEGFYGATTIDTLLSYGSIEQSVFAEPRLSVVADPLPTIRGGGRLGGILLAAVDMVVKLTVEAETNLSAAFGQDWYLSPELTFDWYPEGNLTLGLRFAYARSTSPVLAQLVAGGPALALDQWQRYLGRVVASLVVGRHGLLSLELPVSYYRKGYNAFDGTIDLGVPAWLVAAEPAARLRLSIAPSTTLVGAAGADLALSNNAVERQAAPFVSVSLEVKMPEHP